MSKRVFPSDLLAQARKVLSSWVQIDEQLAFGTMNTARLVTILNRASGIENEITDLENRLTNLRNQRDASNAEVWDAIKRIRAGVKSIFGDDSSEYEMVGGTRTSERKSPRRSVQPAQPTE